MARKHYPLCFWLMIQFNCTFFYQLYMDWNHKLSRNTHKRIKVEMHNGLLITKLLLIIAMHTLKPRRYHSFFGMKCNRYLSPYGIGPNRIDLFLIGLFENCRKHFLIQMISTSDRWYPAKKWPYPPCLRMADRALLAGYPRNVLW